MNQIKNVKEAELISLNDDEIHNCSIRSSNRSDEEYCEMKQKCILELKKELEECRSIESQSIKCSMTVVLEDEFDKVVKSLT